MIRKLTINLGWIALLGALSLALWIPFSILE